jgi:hypothetical protein
MAPLAPTATKFGVTKVLSRSESPTGDVLVDQVLVEFAEVRIVPRSPTATVWVRLAAVLRKVWLVPEVAGVQLSMPFGDVRTVPPSPTATNREPALVTPARRLTEPVECLVHAVALVELRIIPARPTVNHLPAP